MPVKNGVQRVYSGVESVKAANAVLGAQLERRELWPYVHVYPPPNAEPVHVVTLLPVSTATFGTTVEVLEYTVPSGFRFYLQAIVQDLFTGQFNPGDVLWTIDRNTPIGVTNVQAQPEQGLVNIPVKLGSFTFGTQWKLPRAYEFESGDQVRSKAKNISTSENVAGLVSAFLGYILPDLGKQ